MDSILVNTRKKIERVERNEISTVVEIMFFPCSISETMIADRIDRTVCLCVRVAGSTEQFGLDFYTFECFSLLFHIFFR